MKKEYHPTLTQAMDGCSCNYSLTPPTVIAERLVGMNNSSHEHTATTPANGSS